MSSRRASPARYLNLLCMQPPSIPQCKAHLKYLPPPANSPTKPRPSLSGAKEVLRSGTGVAVRSRGFALPAAGKTGTSRDGWFAGFTTELLCVVWVGFDDNRELNLEGARSALPIWAEFMKRAAKFRPYSQAHEFHSPSGVASSNI